MIIQAAYFDGKTSRRHAVELMHRNGVMVLHGDVRRAFNLAEVVVLERAGNRTRKIAFSDGAYLEVSDAASFDALMAEAGYREPIAIRMHHSWRWILVAAVILIAIVVPGYLYGLPAASKMIAKRLPEAAQHAIGREALSFLDQRIFAPSTLSPERQQAIVDRFKTLRFPQAGAPQYEILFRKSGIGPNAFALPSGQIVMTDELVKLLGDDDAVMGVLAHELGHLHERHLLRRVIQGSVVGLVTLVIFGDASSVVTAIPTAMLDMKYSRDAEREADSYAIAMMQANDIPLDGLKLTFEKLGKKSLQMGSYLSSHPPAAERLERIRLAERDSVGR
ncbi:MAG: Zn-dependent protease [Oxalobacter sp.]|nr:MAG: Zn-dependent protease [Oxalobacter sp.]